MNKKIIIFVLAVLFLGFGLFYFPFQKYFVERERFEFIFTAAGDHGLSNKKVTKNTKVAMDTVANSGSDFYIALGDLSFKVGAEKEWCEMFKSKFNYVELIAGNHDTGEVDGGNIDNYRVHCPFVLPNLANPVLAGDYGKRYYFDYPQLDPPLARFILIAPGVRSDLNGLSDLDTYKLDDEGYNFVRDAIDGARTAGINWVIVGMHQNYISTGRKGVEISHDIINLLIDKKVDLILQAHDQNYQRSHALKCITVDSVSPECIADYGDDGLYKKGVGTVIVINGSFSMGDGSFMYSVNANDSEAGYFAKINSTALGVSKYTVSENQIIGEYVLSKESDFTDNFFITAKRSLFEK